MKFWETRANSGTRATCSSGLSEMGRDRERKVEKATQSSSVCMHVLKKDGTSRTQKGLLEYITEFFCVFMWNAYVRAGCQVCVCVRMHGRK